ncbi:MAG: NAD-dependent epimerase/dehydratase family protein [Nocardioidaceae bacterium]
MALVVTGASGFVGAAVVRQLQAEGQHVVTVDRHPLGSGLDGTEHHLIDLAGNPGPLRELLATADAVLHLAGCSGVRDDRPGIEARRRRDNVEATAAVCALTPAATPLVVTSSSSVYGGADHRASREADTLRPRGGYARSKVAVEQVCAQRAARGHVLVVRPFTVVGEGQRADMALTTWAEAIQRAEPVRVFGSPERTRDLTCVREAARALTGLARSGATGTVNLGTGAPRSLAEMVGALEDALGARAHVEVEAAAAREVRDTWADTTRLQSLLGWTPRTDLRDAVARAVAPRLDLAQAA